MRVTAVKQQVKNPSRASIFVDGKYAFSLTLDELVEEKLRVNIELDEIRLKSLKKRSTDGKLRMRVIEWLMNRPHSERELRDYLYKKKVEKDHIDILVEEMQAKRYQDDVVYARWFIDVKMRKDKSNRAITAELLAKGVSRETIETMLEDNQLSEKQRLKELIDKKSSQSRYKDSLKLTRYLVGQGYSYNLVKEVLAEA